MCPGNWMKWQSSKIRSSYKQKSRKVIWITWRNAVNSRWWWGLIFVSPIFNFKWDYLSHFLMSRLALQHMLDVLRHVGTPDAFKDLEYPTIDLKLPLLKFNSNLPPTPMVMETNCKLSSSLVIVLIVQFFLPQKHRSFSPLSSLASSCFLKFIRNKRIATNSTRQEHSSNKPWLKIPCALSDHVSQVSTLSEFAPLTKRRTCESIDGYES